MPNASSTAAGQTADETEARVMAQSLVYEIQFHPLWLNFIFLIQKQWSAGESKRSPGTRGVNNKGEKP